MGAAAACGLGFEPGGYAEVRGVKGGSEAGPETDATVGVDGDLPVVPDGGARVMIIGGRRDPFGPSDFSAVVAETLLVALSEKGEPTGFTYDRSPPAQSTYQGSLLRNGSLYVFAGGPVYRAPVAERITQDWTTIPQRSGINESGQKPCLVGDKGMLSAGGQTNDGGQTVWTTNVYFAPFDFVDAGYGPWTLSASKLVKARQQVTLFAYKKLVYAVGGTDNFCSSCPSREEVEVATLGDDGQPGAFAATQKLINPATNQPLGLLSPTMIAGAGHLFVIGGSLNQQQGASDIAIAAPIDESTGQLGTWKGLPRLPGPLTGAAAVLLPSAVVVFGGQGATSLSDAILALEIKPDGTFGTEWKRVGSLPAPRAGIVAEVY